MENAEWSTPLYASGAWNECAERIRQAVTAASVGRYAEQAA